MPTQCVSRVETQTLLRTESFHTKMCHARAGLQKQEVANDHGPPHLDQFSSKHRGPNMKRALGERTACWKRLGNSATYSKYMMHHDANFFTYPPGKNICNPHATTRV